MTLGDLLKTCTTICYNAEGKTVETTVAKEVCSLLAPNAAMGDNNTTPNTLCVGLSNNAFIKGPQNPPEGDWAFFSFTNGQGELSASAPHLLYTMLCKLRSEWLTEPAESFAQGRLIKPQFRWLAGRDEFLTGRFGFCKRRQHPVTPEDLESSMRELARLGCNHIVINELARRSAETGPKGEVYYRFYDYTPDIDQYVETKLNAGTYPREYLLSNLSLLKSLAKMADKYGLIPGFYAAHPRSVPDSLLAKFPFLRGARIDHTFRSYHPRYNLTVAHPAVRWHQAELIRTLLKEVPELGFIKMLLNDSGSGFEYTASLYSGRNGGPYIVREWRPDDEIARLAANNVIRYYQTLRDAAREINPDFHLMTGLKNIAEEQEPILNGMDTGINLQTQSQRSDIEDPEWQATRTSLESRGAHVLSDTNATGSSYLLGIPCPWVVAKRLQNELDRGFDRIDVYLNPAHLVPHDINRDIIAAYQTSNGNIDIETYIKQVAQNWVGSSQADTLLEIWKLVDKAVENAPIHFLYGWLGFTWYRFWIRPFVPDIAAIPETERAYYEEPMLTVFNNPHNIDFAADALWKLHSIEACDKDINTFDTIVWPALDKAIELSASQDSDFWHDLHDRLKAYRYYTETMRNICAWIASVHGYQEATNDTEREKRHQQAKDMVARELSNAQNLLALWQTSDIDFMPLQTYGESVHNYGLNLGDLLKKKIHLMETYGDREPRIDPNYMFRAPEGFPVSEEEYMKY